MNVEIKEQMYEGKAKQVFATSDPEIVMVHYKDDASVSISARPPRRRWRTKSSVCFVKKSAKCDFFLNLMKKSLTFRLWKDSKIYFD